MAPLRCCSVLALAALALACRRPAPPREAFYVSCPDGSVGWFVDTAGVDRRHLCAADSSGAAPAATVPNAGRPPRP